MGRPRRSSALGRGRRRRRTARRRRGRGTRPRRSSGLPSPSLATTRPTPRCCSRRRSGSSREGWRGGWRGSSRPEPRGGPRAGRRGGSRLPQPLPVGGLVPARRRRAGIGRRGPRPPAPSEAVKERINVEFVSANPTGPITAAGGRDAALGDSIARMLEFAGHSSPASTTSTTAAGRSTASPPRSPPDERGARPRGRLRGRVRHRARQSLEQEGVNPDDLDAVGRRGIALVLDAAEETLRRYDVVFDTLVLGACAARVGGGRACP